MKRNVYGNKRILAVLMVMALVLNVITPVQIFASGADSKTTGYKLVNMAFSAKEALPYTDTATGVKATLERESSTANGTADFATGSLKTTNWNSEEAYWQISFSSKNFKDLTFNASLRSSGTGPANFRVAYSTDGNNFVDLTETIVVTKSVVPISTVTLPELAADQDNLVIRVYKYDNVSINGEEVAASGVSNINNIVVTGTSIDGTLPEIPETPEVSVPVTTEPAVTEPSVEPSPEPSATAPVSPSPSATAPVSPSPSAPVTQEPPVTYADPIADADIPEGVITIDKAYDIEDGTEVTIIGQLQYRYGKNGSCNTAIIEDVIDGEVYGFQVYNALKEYNVGDVLAITGSISTYGSVKQLAKAASGSYTITKIKEEEPIGAQSVTVAQLLEGGDAYLSEYVVIKDAVLGTYSTSNTPITDAYGKSINIYQSCPYPEGLEAGNQANVYAAFSKYNSTYQLRNGESQESFKKTGYEVESSVQTQLAKWAGTAQFTGTIAYGDLFADNDFLDKEARLTLSTGAAPQYINSSSDPVEYYIGSKGLAEGGYYQMDLSSDKYASLDMTFRLRSSGSGAKYYNVLYSTDGVNYEKANNISYTINTTTYDQAGNAVNSSKTYTNMSQLEATASWQTYTVAFPDTAANAKNLSIRLQVAEGNSRIDGKETPISDQYTLRFTSISITGSPIVSSDICRLVTSTPDAGAVALGSEITLNTLTKDAVIYYSLNGAEYVTYDENSKPVLTSLPATITAYAKAEVKEDSVKTTYAYTQAQAATVKASPNGGSVKVDSYVKLSCETEGAKIYYSVDDGTTYELYTDKIQLTKLPQTIKTYATVDGYLNSETKTLNFTERENENYNIYFGQIHSHTNYSDGAGTAKDAFEYASTKVNDLDFLAITDHSNYFDNDTSCTITDGSASKEWVEGNALAEQYTTDKFVGIMGYEMTWSGGAPGHMNTFNTSGFLGRNHTGYSSGSSSSLVNYFASLKTVPDSISQFNHPGTTFGDFYDFGYYDPEIDQLITTIEVGNGEGAIRSAGYFPSYEYYTRALDKGWHLAPTNNQDNHKGNWGSANTGRTVVLADSLTRDNIYDALRNMRAYATEDSNLSIQYTLNDEVMGTILEETPDVVNIAVSLSDANESEQIGKVEVIVNGGLSVASKTITSNSGDVTFTLSPDYSYYYIKVTQPDNDIAVTAPVWISEVDAAGISSVSTTSAMQIQNEAVDVTTELYNNNDTDMDISSIVFAVEGETIKTLEGEELAAAGLNKIASETTGTYTFDFTYNGLGSAAVTVTVNAVMNGITKVYTGKLELNYVPREMVSKVIIDGTHSNDYVTGYYSGGINDLGKLASKYYEEVIIKKDIITKEDLEDCALLVVSAPAKISGTNSDGVAYTPTHFDDAFIALVADYVANGGKVVLCGIADYKDSATTQTSTEMNKLLEAIGATTRVNSDELYDEVNFSNQNYRLYFDDYNMSSKYMDGFIDGMTYSSYSGCGILLDPDAVAAGKAEAIVYGHDTTYSIDSQKYDNNYVEQEKGSIVALAHENIGDNGGGIWVGGTVFLSDYEIDTEIQNNTDTLSYSNTLITANILKECQKELTVTDIAEVRKAAEGEIFTIEGYVTAGTTAVETTFFDTIYVQDDTAGIDIFPFSTQGVAIGQKIRITGYVASYQGDKELMVMSYELLEGSKVYAPMKLTTSQATDYESFGGSLVKVSGTITKVDYAENVLNYIYVQDESGVPCKILIDGYIGSSTGVDNTEKIAKVGNQITAAGILYMNPDGACIRVRDRAEIVLINEAPAPSPTPVSYKITYHLNGGKNASKNPSTYKTGTSVKLANPTKTGYTFAGWYKDASFKTKVTSISASQTGNVTLYAKWTANKYKIAFNKNSSSAKGTMKAISAVYDKSVKLTKVSFTRKGYVFAGWATSAKGKVVYKNAASVKNLTATNGKTVTLYAKWTKVSVSTVSSVTVKASGSKSAKVSWKKVNDAVGYEIIYSRSSSFKKTKTVTVSAKSSSKTITGLYSDSTYYVKVRAYKKDSTGAKVYGKYSSVKKVKIQKKK